MAFDRTIHGDVACALCGYNLRGLTLDHRCPECGTPILQSVHYVVVPTAPEEIEKREQLVARATAISGYSEDAQELVLDVLIVAVNQAKRMTDEGTPTRADARYICSILRDFARYHFGSEEAALLALEAVGIASSADVGRLVLAFIRAGLFETERTDRLEDYEDLFTLDDLYRHDA